MLLEQKIDEVSNRSSLLSIEETITKLQQRIIPPSLNEIKDDDKDVPAEKTDSDQEMQNTLQSTALDYSFAQEQFSSELYNIPHLDYEKLFADEKTRIKKETESEYDASSNNNPETMSMEEAEEMTERYQFAVVLGVLGDISYRERRRFATWADFNPVERELFHRQYAMTNDVNYSKAF